MVGFLFGGDTNETPESIKRKRDIVRALMNGSAPKNVGEGISALGDGIVSAVLNDRANKAEGEGRKSADADFSALSGMFGGDAPMPSPGAATELSSTSPGAAAFDGTDNDVYNGFIDTVKTGVTNPYGLAAVAATGRAESGFSPKNVNRTWSDPSESGKPGTAGGIMSWRGPRYNALAATGDLSPAGQGKFFLQENPQLIKSLNEAKSVEEAQRLMNNAWAFRGYDRPGGEAARRLGYAQGFLPKFQGQGDGQKVASLDPSAGMTGAPQTAPQPQAYVDPMVVSRPQPAPPPLGSGQKAPSVPGSSTLRPFKPGENRPNPDGSHSTEVSTTWQLPDGSWANVPSLWMGPQGPQQFSPDDDDGIMGAMQQYEAANGPTFQRFPDQQSAVSAAQQRSSAGGAGAPALPPPTTVAPPPPVAGPSPTRSSASPPQNQVAQALRQPPQRSNAELQAAQKVLSNPFASDGQRSVAQALLRQELDRRNSEYEMQLKQNDPAYQLGLEKDRLTIDQMRNPRISPAEQRRLDLEQQKFDYERNKPRDPTKMGQGETLVGPDGKVIYKADPKPDVKPSAVQEYEYAKNQGFPGTFQDWEASKKGGMSLQVDPATGAVTFQQGGNIKPMTEGQSKDTVYATRAEGALARLNENAASLSNLGESMASGVPVAGNYMLSPEFQQAQQAGKEFLQAILRKDTGAAITREETSEYGTVYLPQPGDSPEVSQQKAVSRTRALEALKAGMPPQAIIAKEKALTATGDKKPAAGGDPDFSKMSEEELQRYIDGK